MSPSNRSRSISFRLPVEIAEIANKSAIEHGLSLGHWVRGQILMAVNRPDKDELAAILGDIYSSIEKTENHASQLEKRIKSVEASVSDFGKSLTSINRKQLQSLFLILTRVGQIDQEVALKLVKDTNARKEA